MDQSEEICHENFRSGPDSGVTPALTVLSVKLDLRRHETDRRETENSR